MDIPQTMTRAEIAAALDLWRDGAAKRWWINVLDDVVNAPQPIPVAERIAAFDNDGTVAVEKPHTSVKSFLVEQTTRLDPTGAVARALHRLPIEASYLAALPALGRDVDSYAAQARDFIDKYRHPRYDLAWPELIYPPMLQLMGLLQLLGFTVFLVSGSSRDFLRVMAPNYRLLPQDIIGTEFRIHQRHGQLLRSRRIPRQDVGREKPEHLWNRSGAHPLIAVGNTSGDIQLLRSARFAAPVCHDDTEREYSYRDTKAEHCAATEGWQKISIRDDFTTLFPRKPITESL